MIEKKDLLSLEFYKKSPFTGSFKKMRYRIEKSADNESLVAITYPQPFCFDKTDDSLKTSKSFPFSDEGLSEVCDWLNSRIEAY